MRKSSSPFQHFPKLFFFFFLLAMGDIKANGQQMAHQKYSSGCLCQPNQHTRCNVPNVMPPKGNPGQKQQQKPEEGEHTSPILPSKNDHAPNNDHRSSGCMAFWAPPKKKKRTPFKKKDVKPMSLAKVHTLLTHRMEVGGTLFSRNNGRSWQIDLKWQLQDTSNQEL